MDNRDTVIDSLHVALADLDEAMTEAGVAPQRVNQIVVRILFAFYEVLTAARESPSVPPRHRR